MTTLLQILAATLLSSVLSIVLAGLISFKFLDRYMSLGGLDAACERVISVLP